MDDLVDLDYLIFLFKELKKANIQEVEHTIQRDHQRHGVKLINARLLLPILESDNYLKRDGEFWQITGAGLRFKGYLKDHYLETIENREPLIFDLRTKKTNDIKQKIDMNKIFISHSSKDVNLVKSFVSNILILGLDIPAERIFCSSMEGQGVKSGQYIPDRLKEEINRSSIALLFISKNYKTSEVCLNEIGAAWAVLSKENVIPLILPDADFNELGFIDLGRLGLKIDKREGVIKFIQDCKEQLNPNFNLEKLFPKIDVYLTDVSSKTEVKNISVIDDETEEEEEEEEEEDEWTNCYTNNLYALNLIIRRNIPAHNDGVHKILDKKSQSKILTDLSKAKFLKSFWYKYANGDYYVEKLRRLPSGNWLMSTFNWELNISDMWVSMNSDLQYEFVLIRSEKQEPFKINSDVGGTAFDVGVLSDGTIVSENERLNGYAVIDGETIDLSKFGIEQRIRKPNSHWIFLVSRYHKLGYNADETFELCKKLDNGDVKVNGRMLFEYQRSLRNHPTVIMYM